MSPWLAGELRPGDQFELRGPGGRSFSWHAEEGGPLLLVGGGAGLVPLRAMVRHRLALGADVETAVVLSARTRGSLLYADEIATWPEQGVRTHVTYTREGGRRLDAEQLSAFGPARARLRLRADGVRRAHHARPAEIGHEASRVRAERFGGAT